MLAIYTGITKLSLLIFLFNRTAGSPNGSLSRSVAWQSGFAASVGGLVI
jgi:hypothetical protein